MTSEVGLLGAGVIAVVLVAWYSAANQRWVRLVRARHSGLQIDSVAQPVMWLASAPDRMRRFLELLRSPSDEPELELARRQVLNRFVSICVLGPIALFGLPAVVPVIVYYSTIEIAHGGALIGGVFSIVLIGIFSYWLYRLVLAAWRFGNAEAIGPTAFAMPVFGIVATLVGAWFIASTTVGAIR